MNIYELPTCSRCQATQARHRARFCRSCGEPLENTAQTQGLDPDVVEGRIRVPRPRWWRPLLVTGAVVAALALTAAGLRNLQDGMGGPAEPVEELLEQIADGRGEELHEYAGGKGVLLQEQTLAEGYTPPEDLRVTDVVQEEIDADTLRPDKDFATVHIAYELGGKTHSAFVKVQREETGWLRGWEILDPKSLLGELVVTSNHVDRVRVAAGEVDTVSPQWDVHGNGMAALPGTYTLATAEEVLFLSGESLGEVTVFGSGDVPTTVVDVGPTELTVREGLVDGVMEQVAEYLEECAEAEVLVPPGCPLRLERSIFRTVTDVAWTITSMPEIVLVPSVEAGLHGASLAVETSTPGSAEVEWSYVRTEDEEPGSETVEVFVAGTVTVDEHGEPEWSP